MIVAREQVESYSLPDEPNQSRQPRRRAGGLPRGQRLVAAGLVFLFFATGIVIAFYCAQLAATGYRIHKLDQELAMLRKETHGLHGEISRMDSLERVEAMAVSRLGMVRPEVDQVVRIKTDSGTAATMLAANNDPGAAGTEEPVATGAVPEATTSVGAEEERNWVIQAFVDLFGQLEYRLRNG